MRRHSTARLRAYATAGLIGLVASLAIGHPEPALLGVPILAIAVMGIISSRTPGLTVGIGQAPTSMVEGEERVIGLDLDATEPIRNLHLDLALGPGLGLVGAEGAHLVDRKTLVLDLFGPKRVDVKVTAAGWGRRSLGPIVAYADSAFGMVEMRSEFGQMVRMLSIPSDASISEILTPRETNLHAGDLVSRLRGVGSEFSELRPYNHGDDPRALNWRVSSRSGEWWVNDRHPERNGDVILVVDAQTQPGTGTDILVDRAVRLAGTLFREYGRRRFRLGLVTVDGVARWIQPGSGEAHRRRVLEQLLGVEGGDSNRAALERAVLRVAKRPALVIMLTPLLDDGLAGLAHALRVSGHDLALVEIDPIGFLAEPANETRALGRRVWRMERERLRDLLARDGIPVAPWRSGEPPDVPLARISTWRSAWRLPV